MTRLILLALTLLAITPLRAQEKFDYPTALALAVERTQVRPDSNIFILGPTQNEEYYIANGKELRRTLPYISPIGTQSPTTIERLRSGGNGLLGGGAKGTYQLLVYRADSPTTPIVRLEGDNNTLSRSQFPLKPGDILVITAIPSKK